MSAVSRIPHELWQRVFAFAATSSTDPHAFIEFFIAARQVCHTWRANIARAYLDTFVRNPRRCMVYFDLGTGYFEAGKCFLGMEMYFDRLDPDDKSRCIFKESDETSGAPSTWDDEEKEEYIACKYNRWYENTSTYLGADEEERSVGGRFHLTPYVLSIYGSANDSELPNLQVDYSKREISFEWEGMLTAFSLELDELTRRSSGRAKAMADQTKASLTDPAKMAQTMINAMRALVGMMSNNRKDVRRYRIKKFYKRHHLNFSDDMFDEEAEKEQLMRIEQLEGVGRDDDDEEEGEGGSDEDAEEDDDAMIDADDGWISEDE